ncbi:MAG: RNA polymerase sigma factor FliA [Methylococcaceae bacterium]|nr:RNA polymerase sigma factor FliA [Methylococcaceae bacterium]
MSGAARYASVQSGSLNDQVILQMPLVKRIAYHLLTKLPDSVLLDDLIQSGVLGLLEALKHYDAAQGASFETYAGIRIRGAMLDEVRRSDWTPRSVHKKAREVAAAIREIESKTGRDASANEVAENLGISVEEYGHILQDSLSCRIFSVEELSEEGEGIQVSEMSGNPFDKLSKAGFQQALADAIANLPERERLVVSLYYDEELNLREIGEVLNISESRASQINSQAMLRLRARLGDWMND